MFWPRFFKTRFFWEKCFDLTLKKNYDNDNIQNNNFKGLDTIEITLVT